MFRELAIQWKETEKRIEPVREFTVCILRSVAGDVNVLDRPSYVWASEMAQPQSNFMVLNRVIVPLAGLQVVVGFSEKKDINEREVLGIWDGLALIPGGMPGGGGPVELPAHHLTHEQTTEATFGSDVVNTFQPMLQPLRARANGLNMMIVVQNLSYWTTSRHWRFFIGGNVDLTPYIPSVANKKKFVLIYLDRQTNHLGVVSGTEVPNNPIYTAPFPDRPPQSIPALFVLLRTGQTLVDPFADVIDPRTFLGDDDDSASTLTPRQDGDILIGYGGSFVPALPLVDGDGYILTDGDGLIVWA